MLVLVSPILYETIDFIIDNLLIENSCNNKYLSLISNVQSSIREIVRNVVITTFQEIDNNFKESACRKSRYYINKSNVNNISRQSVYTRWQRTFLFIAYFKTKDKNYFKAAVAQIIAKNQKRAETITINEDIANSYTCYNFSNVNIPILNDGNISPIYQTLNDLAH